MKRALSSTSLYSETPMRVRSSSTGGTSSGSKFSCQRSTLRKSAIGPVSRLSLVGRPSIGGAARRSSAQDGGKKDIRSQTDKESTKKNLQTLINFLQDPHARYPYGISPRLAVGPSAKDVTNMFEFLVKMVMPDYETGKKFEDEFPRVLKLMGFPYTVAKRNLQPVASLHNWPTIVYGLSWLCGVVKYHGGLEDEPLTIMGDSQECVIKRYTDKLYQEAYNRFMDGSDDFTDIYDRFIGDLPDMMGGMNDVKRVEELRQRLANLVGERDGILETQETLQKGVDSLMSDIGILDAFLQNLNTFVGNKEMDFTSQENELQLKAKQIEDLRASIATKEEVIKNQRMSPEDVLQLSAQLKSVTSQVIACREALKRAREEFNDKTAVVTKIGEKVLSNIEEYHAASSACGLTPSTAANARGYDYSIRTTNFDSNLCYADIQGMTGRLNLILKQWKEATREAKKAEMQSMENLTAMQQSLAVKKSEVSDMEAQSLRQQESIKLTKQEHTKELSCYLAELTATEEQCNDIRKATIRSTEEIESLEKELKSRTTEAKALRDEEFAKSREFQVSLCELFIDHKRTVVGKIFNFRQRVKVFADGWRKINVSLVKLENIPDVERLKITQKELADEIEALKRA